MILDIVLVWCFIAFILNFADWHSDRNRRERGVLEYWRGWFAWTLAPITIIPMLLMGARVRVKKRP